MPLTIEDHFEDLLAELELIGDDGVIQRAYPLFETYADKAVVGGVRLQILYALRDALLGFLISVAGDSDYQVTDIRESGTAHSKNYQSVFNRIQAEIDKIERWARANVAPAIGTLTRTAPIMTSAPALDPNGSAYRGDPLTARRGPY